MKDNNAINERIRANKIRLIDENGQNLGIVTLQEALAKAREKNLDLVEMTKNPEASICRILDYNKYLYDQKNRFKKAKSKKVEVKEFIIKPNIGEGDLDTKIKRAKEFLEGGDIVKIRVKFQGREIAFPENGLKKLKIIESELADVAKIDKFSENPHSMFQVFVPKG